MFLTADLFIDAIVLLINQPTKIIKSLITELLVVSEEELQSGTYMNDEFIRLYVALIKELLALDAILMDSITERSTVLLKFQSNATILANRNIYDTLTNIFTDPDKPTDRRINEMTNRMKNQVLWYNSSKVVKKMFAKLNNFTATTDKERQENILTDIKVLSTDITTVFTQVHSSGSSVVDRVDFSDKIAISQALKSFKNRKQTNIFKFGLQGINRMFGYAGGSSLGESVVFNALSHHYKSSMLMDVARWVIQYNTPVGIEGGVPTVLFVSLENETAENMMTLYKNAYVSVTQTSSDGKSDEEIIDFIHEFFNQNGWKLIIERRLGQSFGAQELQDVFNEYESCGHKILCTVIDYMNMMKKNGNDSMGNHLQLRELYTTVVNFLKHKGSSLFTAHQLNRDAAKVASSGLTNVVEKFGIGYLADGMDPQREVDVVIFLHIEKNNFNIPYLTMRIDKHRYTVTEEAWKRTAYRFGPFGIPDDFHGKDMSVSDIYADKYVPVEGPLLTSSDIPEENVPPIQPGEAIFME